VYVQSEKRAIDGLSRLNRGIQSHFSDSWQLDYFFTELTWAEIISGIHDAHVNKRPAKKAILLMLDRGMGKSTVTLLFNIS
jgi:hypothetical protein